MKKILLTFLILHSTFFILNPASAQRFPIVLTQNLYSAPESILISHRHDVTVVLDTVNCIYVRTTGRPDELDSLRFPEGQIHMNGSQISIDSAFPYRSGIEVHTAAHEVKVSSSHLSRVTVRSHNGQAVRLKSFEATAYSSSLIFVDAPLDCQGVVTLGAHQEGAVVYYDTIIRAAECRYNLILGGLVVHRLPDGGSETHKVMKFLPFGYLDLFSPHSANHRDYPIFMTFSYGLSGASQQPFGGLTGWMGDYSMNTGYQLNYSAHYSFAFGSHWSLGVGFGTGASIYRADNCLLGITPNATDGQPAHLGPVAAPATSSAGQHTWSSKFGVAYMYLPLRAEWRQRNDWRGLRAAVELQPGINYYRSSTILYNNGLLTDGSRTDLLADKTLGERLASWRCDLRLEVAWSHIGVFFQTSLMQLFRTDGEDGLDRKYFPMSVGFSFTI